MVALVLAVTVALTRCMSHLYMLPDEVMRKRGWNTGLLLRHEIGHCNGWPSDHPGQRPHDVK